MVIRYFKASPGRGSFAMEDKVAAEQPIDTFAAIGGVDAEPGNQQASRLGRASITRRRACGRGAGTTNPRGL